MGSRRKARELALQLLFQQEVSRYSPHEVFRNFAEAHKVGEETRAFATRLFTHYLENRSRIDDLIRRHAEHWRLDRMAAVDRNILRAAVSEFLCTDTPRVVVIDQAIEIARKFSGEEATEFVNGILDAVRKEIEAGEGTEETAE